MRLALHIGTPKTGTTSFQRWFADHRVALREQGVVYPETPGAVNHRHLTVYAQDSDKPDKHLAHLGIHSPQDHDRFRQKLRADFAAELHSHAGAHLWVMSNEHLYSRIRTIEMIERLQAFLHPGFEQIDIYVHLRPQVDLLVSGASQRARLGQEVSVQTLTRPGVSEISAYFNYNMTLKRWVHVFGQKHVHLVPFRQHPDMTAYLSDQLGIERAGMARSARVNTALDWRAMALVNGLGDQAGAVGFLAQNLFLDQMPVQENLQIGLELAQEIQGRFVKSNTELVARHGDIALADMEPDWTRYEAPPNVQQLPGAAVYAGQMAFVVKRYRQELRLERVRALLAEAELLSLKQDPQADLKRAEARSELQFHGALLADLQPRKSTLLKRLNHMESKE